MNNTAFLAITDLVDPECLNNASTWIAIALGVLFGLSEALGVSKVKTNGLVHSVQMLVTSQCLREKEKDNETV